MHVKRNSLWAALFVGPALFLTGFYLLYPSAQTIWLSLMDGRSINFVGLDNYKFAFSSNVMLQAFRNNLIWLIVFTSSTVVFGLIMAIIFDRVRYESVAKTAIFMPMAISFVGAGIIWKFMYAYKPATGDQIGLLNQLMVSAGAEPQGWLIYGPLMNNLALIAVGVWTWTGFCMVILSAAYKGIPKELLEAATVDGASDLQRLRYIVLPFMGSTIAVVAVTMIVTMTAILFAAISFVYKKNRLSDDA